MKKTSILMLAALMGSASAFAETPADSVAADTAFVFTDVITLRTTPVKNQNKSGTCWCFAGTSFIEDEMLRKGAQAPDLSEMYTVRKCYEEKAERYVRLYGQTNFSPGGSLSDVPHVLKRYGAVPEEAYRGLEYGEDKHVHGELNDAMTAFLKAVVSKPDKKVSTAWRKALKGILDAYLGEVPETFVVDGKTYTPESYAASLPVDADDYVSVTSFTHHPYYESFAIEVPDNWLWSQSYNVPLDEFKSIVDNALDKGYPVLWAADVSEGGFKWYDGVAVMPKSKDEADMNGTELARWVKLSSKDRAAAQFDFKGPVEEIEVTPESRQAMFDSQETTDDHAMEIVGTAVDQKGNRYYKVKNSWDTNQVYDGFFYVSEPYFLAKTMNIIVNRAALPSATVKKLKLK